MIGWWSDHEPFKYFNLRVFILNLRVSNPFLTPVASKASTTIEKTILQISVAYSEVTPV